MDSQQIPAQGFSSTPVEPVSTPLPPDPQVTPLSPAPVVPPIGAPPTPLPTQSVLIEPVQVIQPNQPITRTISKRSVFILIISLVLLYLLGVGGTWLYYRYAKTPSNPTKVHPAENRLPPSFSILDSYKIHSPEEAINAVKAAYPNLKNVQVESPDFTSWINAKQRKNGWNIAFMIGTGTCLRELEGCEHEYRYFFTVGYDGSINKIGENQKILDPTHTTTQKIGDFFPDFLKNEE